MCQLNALEEVTICSAINTERLYAIISTLFFSPHLNRDRIRDARAVVLTAMKRVYEWVGVPINTYNLVEGRFDVIEGTACR
jgi:hypothetical protein